MRAYIAGPMRGYERYNFPAFDTARDWMLANGWEPVNPADLDREIGVSGFTEDLPDGFIFDALRRDFTAICTCEGMVLLPGWEKSSGARAERFVGQHIGLKFFTFDPETLVMEELRG